MVLPVSFLTRRNLLIGEGARRLHRPMTMVGTQPQHIPPMAASALSIRKAIEHLKTLEHTSEWTETKKELYHDLIIAFDTAVSEIPDEDLKDLLSADKIMYTYE
jgi:hypothetical protein